MPRGSKAMRTLKAALGAAGCHWGPDLALRWRARGAVGKSGHNGSRRSDARDLEAARRVCLAANVAKGSAAAPRLLALRFPHLRCRLVQLCRPAVRIVLAQSLRRLPVLLRSHQVSASRLAFVVIDGLQPQFHFRARRTLQVVQEFPFLFGQPRPHLHHLEISNLLAGVAQFEFQRREVGHRCFSFSWQQPPIGLRKLSI